jgi:hypothetical protein
MKLARRPRLITTLLALISVLFTHVAVAAYVCPTVQVAQAFNAIAHAGALHEQHAGTECEGADPAQQALCQAHLQGGAQSLDKPMPPQVAPFIAVTLASAYIERDPYTLLLPLAGASSSPTRDAAPPLSIQYCCFRI